jgi:hypothetical protein
MGGLACLLASHALRVEAGPPQETLAQALAAADPDALAVARVAVRHGEVALLALLEPGRPVAEQLLALRAVPWLDAPWQVLPALAALLRSRDSELAPAAAAALLAIVDGLDGARLDRSEVERAPLCRVVPQLRAAAEDAAVRQDVQLTAGVAAHVLDGLCDVAGPDAGP